MGLPRMDTASVVPHGVPPSTRDGWKTIEHRVLKRRGSVADENRFKPNLMENPGQAFENGTGIHGYFFGVERLHVRKHAGLQARLRDR